MTAEQGERDIELTISDLPNTILAVVAEQLTNISEGSCKDVVKWAASTKHMWMAMEDSVSWSHFWEHQCTRLGWSLDWLGGTKSRTEKHAWTYFCYRMNVRWLLRRRLKHYKPFVNFVSRVACRPPASISAIQHAEALLHCRLPFELFELLRAHDGQDDSYVHRISFVKGARLLRLDEIVAQTLERHDVALIQETFEDVLTSIAAVQYHATMNQNTTNLNSLSRFYSFSQFHQHQHQRQEGVSHSGLGQSVEAVRVSTSVDDDNDAPDVMIPFTTEMRGKKQYCFDLYGRIWLTSGFNVLHVADGLTQFLHRTLI